MKKQRIGICLAGIVAFASIVIGETILQDFTSKKDFDAFWDISTWGNADQQYSAANVKLDTANGWVQLKLNASPQGTTPICGEITSKRSNFLYGSYRASIKFDNTPGAVVGWFVYKDVPDLHEIDVEFLTKDVKNIHYTLHHIETDVDYRKDAITFDPTTAFHEYRFDWYGAKVIYFIDGKKFDSLSVKVPDSACAIMLNFWSGNIDEWGGPAPTRDTYMYIDYMHYYSDYGVTSTASDKSGNEMKPKFRNMRRNQECDRGMKFADNSDARLFKCNGQRVGNEFYSGAAMPLIPGMYVRNAKSNFLYLYGMRK
jgi:beta-glucanase (GH16 family)